MSIIKGLKSINKYYEKEDQKFSGGTKDDNYVPVPYLKVKDGQTVPLRFLQELDEDSPSYNEKAGVGFVAVEHQAAGNFKRRALCSTDENDAPCFGCEQHPKDYKAGWGQKAKLYINVLADIGEGPKVYVLSQGNGPKSVTPWLLEYAGDSGSITSQTFKLKRKGSGQKDTEYTLVPGKFDEEKYDSSQHELVDLNNCVRDIPYEEQEKFYLDGKVNDDPQSTEDLSSTKVDW